MGGGGFYGAKMLSDATLSSWIGGSQCSDKVITASKRFLFIIIRYQFRYRVGYKKKSGLKLAQDKVTSL